MTYGFRYRDRTTGRQRWIGLGLHGSITADEARALAKKRAGEVADNRDPAAERAWSAPAAEQAEANTVNAVLDAFLDRYVRKTGLRSGDAVRRRSSNASSGHVSARARSIQSAGDIVELLDDIEDQRRIQ